MSDQVAVDLQDRTPEHSTFYNCEIHLEECDCNGRSFESGTVRAKQELSMSRPKSQTCKLCGKVLASPSSYYVHLKLHSGNKPFQCKQCEACFSRKPYLEAHMRSHTGERPFQCTVCLKWFSQKSSLNTHKRVHTGERPYSCDLCDKKFAVKSYVTAHRWSHLGDKPLVCQKCNITFTSKHEFALHDRIHVTGTDFECHMCGRVFSKESYLIRHINRVHQDSKDTGNDIQAHASFMNGMCTDSRRRNATSTCGDPNFQTISVGSTAPIDANLTADMPPNVMSLNHFMIPC